MGSCVVDSMIMFGVMIGKNVVIDYVLIGEDVVIGDDVQIIGMIDKIVVVGYYEMMGVE